MAFQSRSRKVSELRWAALGGLPVVLFLLFVGLPLAAILARGAGEPGFISRLTDASVLQPLRITFATSLITLAVICVACTPVSYVLARKRFPGRDIVDSLVELPTVLPPVVAGLGMLMAFGQRSEIGQALEAIGISLPFSMTAVVFAQIFVSAPFFIRAAKIGFESVDRSLEETALTLGAPPLQVFFRITLPLASRSMIGGAVLSWTRAIGEFGATLMFAGSLAGRTQTMPLAIMAAFEHDLGATLALATVLMAISLAVLVVTRLLLRRWSVLT
ncbi:MAG: molybdate ABC transporter permease subunit [SAR202 cluster bacterium]|nr:molybdate ABC transporter permease subunit [SAR202 cluster bacterium]